MCNKPYCVAVLTFLALGMFVLIMRFTPDFLTWTEWPLCEGSGCNLQGWLSATSGWAGFLAAGIALAFTWGQLRQQRKQTDFLLGDAPPTMDVIPDSGDDEQIVVRVVNWNRRMILLKSTSLNFGDQCAVMEAKRDEEVVQPNWPFYLGGWEDRNGRGPMSLQLKLAVNDAGKLVKEWPSDATVTIEIQMLDSKHKLRSLQASVLPD